MTQGLDRRTRYLERGRKEPLPWLKHKLYLMRLWTGAYMLDNWEVVLLTVLISSLIFYGYYTFSGSSQAVDVETIHDDDM